MKKKDPIGEVFLKKGELWKIGTSKDAFKRYSSAFLDRVGVDMKIIHTGITKQLSLALERMKLKGYFAWKGFLPGGNKCFH